MVKKIQLKYSNLNKQKNVISWVFPALLWSNAFIVEKSYIYIYIYIKKGQMTGSYGCQTKPIKLK